MLAAGEKAKTDGSLSPPIQCAWLSKCVLSGSLGYNFGYLECLNRPHKYFNKSSTSDLGHLCPQLQHLDPETHIFLFTCLEGQGREYAQRDISFHFCKTTWLMPPGQRGAYCLILERPFTSDRMPTKPVFLLPGRRESPRSGTGTVFTCNFRMSHPLRPSDYIPGTQNRPLITRQGIPLGRRLLSSGCVCFVGLLLVAFCLTCPAFYKKHLASFSKIFVCAYMSVCVSVHGGQQRSTLASVCSFETGSLCELGTCIFSEWLEASNLNNPSILLTSS